MMFHPSPWYPLCARWTLIPNRGSREIPYRSHWQRHCHLCDLERSQHTQAARPRAQAQMRKQRKLDAPKIPSWLLLNYRAKLQYLRHSRKGRQEQETESTVAYSRVQEKCNPEYTRVKCNRGRTTMKSRKENEANYSRHPTFVTERNPNEYRTWLFANLYPQDKH